VNIRTSEQLKIEQKTMKDKKYDLEERLIDFAVAIIHFVETLPNTKSANHLGGQLLRSGTSPSLNYGEARSAESQKILFIR
jgi:four helix bundle protein